jgi:hypothetical protein
MAIYILTLRSTDEQPKLIKNLGVFERRATAFHFVVNAFRQHVQPFIGGTFKISDANQLPDEGEMGNDPSSLLLYYNFNYKVYIERSELH